MFDSLKDQIAAMAWEVIGAWWHYLAVGVVSVFLVYSLIICLFRVSRKYAAETFVACLIGMVILYLVWPEKKVFIPPVTVEEAGR